MEPDAEIVPQLEYSKGEELANSISHGVGAGLGIAALSVLVVLASVYGDAWRIVSFSVYGTTLVLLFLMSTLYHSITHPKAKHVFKVLDHIAIYLLIAGTYTPFTLITLRGTLGWVLFGLIWGLAAVGIVFKSFWINRYPAASLILYIAMGWLVLIAIYPMFQNLATGGMVLLGAGGLSYTAGAGLYAWERLPYNHFIWHMCVLAGAICHFLAILLYVLPMPASGG